jgi:hypothetical protein
MVLMLREKLFGESEMKWVWREEQKHSSHMLT